MLEIKGLKKAFGSLEVLTPIFTSQDFIFISNSSE